MSITEVRLSKDIEEEQSRDKARDKHNTSDSNGEYIAREETVVSKNEGSRKGDTKSDNHMGEYINKLIIIKYMGFLYLSAKLILRLRKISEQIFYFYSFFFVKL